MKIGAIIFTFIAVMNSLSLFITYKIMNNFSIASSCAGIFFNFLLGYMFLYWSKQAEEQEGNIDDLKEIQEALQDIKE